MQSETKAHSPERYNLPSKIVTNALWLKPKQDHQVFEATDTSRINDAHSAMYITKTRIGEDGRQKYALIDFGMDPEGLNLIRWLRMHDGDTDDVEWGAITHVHDDHIGGLRLFKEGIPIHVSEHDSHVLLGELPSEGWLPGLKDKLTGRHNAHIEDLNLKIIEDGFSETIGDLVIRAISMSGHTYGSLGYLLGPGKNGKHNYVSGDSHDVRRNGRIKNAARPFTEDRRASKQAIIDFGNLVIAEGISLDFMLSAHSGEADLQALIQYVRKHQRPTRV